MESEQLVRTREYWTSAGLDGLTLTNRNLRDQTSAASVLHDPSSFSVVPEILPEFLQRLLAPTNIKVRENWAAVRVEPGTVSGLRGAIRASEIILCAGVNTEHLVEVVPPSKRHSWTTTAELSASTEWLARIERLAAAGADCSPEPDYFTSLPSLGRLKFGISHDAPFDLPAAMSVLRTRLAALFPGIPLESIGLGTTRLVDHSDDGRPIIMRLEFGRDGRRWFLGRGAGRWLRSGGSRCSTLEIGVRFPKMSVLTQNENRNPR